MNLSAGNTTTQKDTERLLGEIARLRRRLRGSNADIKFSDVCADYPELAQALFSGRDLRQSNLRGADLRGIDFRGSDLSGCEFSGALIAGARFDRAKVARAALRRAADWAAYRANWEAEPDLEEQDDRTTGFFRNAGERFSLSPLLPEMIILSASYIPDPNLLDDREHLAFEAGRLALAVRALTNREIVLLAAPEREAEANDETAARPGYAARSYCRQLTARARAFGLPKDTDVRLPSYRLLFAIDASDISDPSTRPNDLATDLSIADLRLGRDGAEFTRLDDSGELALFFAERKRSRVSRPRNAQIAGARPSLVRPIFLLGKIR